MNKDAKVHVEHLGVQGKLDFDQIIYLGMAQLKLVSDYDRKISIIESLEGDLYPWAEEEHSDQIIKRTKSKSRGEETLEGDFKTYLEATQDLDKTWFLAYVEINTREVHAFKRRYFDLKYRELVKLMHRLSLLGKVNLLPQREEKTTISLRD